jgi:predicted Zn-dependent peptidase
LLIQESTTALESQRSEPNAMGSQAMSLALDVYKKGDVRAARSLDESLTALKASKLDQVKQFHSNFYGANHSQFALVGEFDSEAVKSQLNQLFGDWKSPKKFTRAKSPKPKYQRRLRPSTSRRPTKPMPSSWQGCPWPCKTRNLTSFHCCWPIAFWAAASSRV